MAHKVTSKGQVTIPKAIRDHLGIEPGSTVTFELDHKGHVVLANADGTKPKSRFEHFRGFAGPGPSTDEIMTLLRGE